MEENTVKLEDGLKSAITFFVTPEMLRKLKEKAREDSRSLSSYVRLALEKYLEKEQ